MLDGLGDDDAKDRLSAPRPSIPVNIAETELSKLKIFDKESTLLPPTSIEQASTSYGSSQSKEVALFMQASELEHQGKVSQGTYSLYGDCLFAHI